MLCMVSVPNDSLIYTYSTDDFLKAAEGIIERYQVFLDDSSLTEMIDSLNAVDTLKDATLTVGNIKLDIKTDDQRTSFYWKHTFNGVDYNEIQLTFEPSGIKFSDHGSRYKMGSTDIKILEQQAIDIAVPYVEAYSYPAIGGTQDNQTVVEISGFVVDKERTTAQALTVETGGLLYPCWKVTVALVDVYPGNVYTMSIFVWADSGDVFDCTPEAVGGYSEIETSPTENPTIESSPLSEPSNENKNLPLEAIIVATVAIVMVLASSVAIALFKKRSK